MTGIRLGNFVQQGERSRCRGFAGILLFLIVRVLAARRWSHLECQSFFFFFFFCLRPWWLVPVFLVPRPSSLVSRLSTLLPRLPVPFKPCSLRRCRRLPRHTVSFCITTNCLSRPRYIIRCRILVHWPQAWTGLVCGDLFFLLFWVWISLLFGLSLDLHTHTEARSIEYNRDNRKPTSPVVSIILHSLYTGRQPHTLYTYI